MEKANITFIKSAVLALFLSIVLTACGGGGGGGVTAGASGTGASGTGASGTGVVGAGTAAVTPSILSGIAATGAAIQGTVYLKDSAGTVKSRVIASDGSYSFDVTGLTPPFYLRAVSDDKKVKMHSVAMAPGIANINPITNWAVAEAAGTNDPGESFEDPKNKPITETSINNAITTIMDQFKAIILNAKYNNESDEASDKAENIKNPLSDPFKANQKGFDRVLDDLKFDVNTVSGVVSCIFASKDICNATIGQPSNKAPITAEEVSAALAIQVVNSLTGAGNNTPYEATMVARINQPNTLSDTFSYSYQGMLFIASTIDLSIAGDTATITGTGTINRLETPGFTFTATITDGATDSFDIEINNPNGSTYYSSLSDSLTSGDGFTVDSGGNSVSGAGNNTPYEATLSVNIDGASDSLIYDFRDALLRSSSITRATSIGGVITIEGSGSITVDRTPTPGYTFTATIIDASTDAFGIVINDPNGNLYYSTTTDAETKMIIPDPLTSGTGF